MKRLSQELWRMVDSRPLPRMPSLWYQDRLYQDAASGLSFDGSLITERITRFAQLRDIMQDFLTTYKTPISTKTLFLSLALASAQCDAVPANSSSVEVGVDLIRYLNLAEAVYQSRPSDTGSFKLVHFEPRKVHSSYPAFAIFVDDAQKEVVLVVRGTASIKDAVIDLNLAPYEFQGSHVHVGMLHAAQEVLHLAAPVLERFCDHKLTLTGHSLGGGVAALIGALRRPQQAVLFAPAACVSLELSKSLAEFTVSVVNEADCVPRLTYNSVSKLSHQIASIDLQQFKDALFKDKSPAVNLLYYASEDLIATGIKQLIVDMREEAALMDKKPMPVQLYPPGNVMHLQGGKLLHREAEYWSQLELSPSMVEDHFLKSYRKSLD